MVGFEEFFGLNEYVIGFVGGVVDMFVGGLEEFDEDVDDVGRCIEFFIMFVFGCGEFFEEVFVDFVE